MAKSIRDITKPRGRPKTTGKGQLLGVRVLPDLMAALDAWRAKQPDLPSRPEAIRRLVERGLHGRPATASKAQWRRRAEAPPAPPTQELAEEEPVAIKGRKRRPKALPGG